MGRIYLFLTPSKTDGRIPSQQSVPTTYNLTYWEVPSRRISRLLATLGVARGQNLDLHGGGEISDKKTHARYSTHQIPTDTHN